MFFIYSNAPQRTWLCGGGTIWLPFLIVKLIQAFEFIHLPQSWF
jgi:hypothetical protein